MKFEFFFIFSIVTTLASEFTPPPPNVTNHVNLKFLDHELCGPINEFKAFGGTEVEIFDFPWMALLQYEVEDGNKTYLRFLCGGSIISSRYILTAAHCVKYSHKNVYLKTVRLGEHNLNTDPDCEVSYYTGTMCVEKYQEYEIEKILPHPEYSSVHSGNDIALLKLKQDVDFTPSNIKPICLPIGRASNLRQEMVTVSGWGLTETMSFSDNLLMVHLPAITNEECNKAYRRLPKKVKINYKQMCAGGVKGRDACSRDSGGPLQSPAIYNKNVRFVQYGIVSYGYSRCGTEGIPGVYTKVSYYMDWILDNIDK